MNYYIKEVYQDELLQKTAGVKARDDVEEILESEGFKCISIKSRNEERKYANKLKKLLWHFKIVQIWLEQTQNVKNGEILFVQIPVVEHSLFLDYAFRKLKKRGVKVVLLIHDLESLRFSKRKSIDLITRIRLIFEDKILSSGSYVIVHNNAMKKTIFSRSKNKTKLISLGIFDYLIKDYDQDRMNSITRCKNDPLIIAGNLRRHKAAYVYDLPTNISYNLYGVDFEDYGHSGIIYHGAFEPDELPYKLEGSFGIVWDGNSSKTCEGIYGEYLKINNPHKTSLYLASGIPVIIWKEAALASFVEKNKCGITVDSLNDVSAVIEKLSDKEYEEIKRHAESIGVRLRYGYFLKRAISNCK